MMQLSMLLRLCQCAILLVSLGGTVCTELFEFAVDTFGTADIYSSVVPVGNNKTGRLVLQKSTVYVADKGRRHLTGRELVLRIPDILRNTIVQEREDPKILSFSVAGESGNFKIKFKTATQASNFIGTKIHQLSSHFRIHWARIYSNTIPVTIAYDQFHTGNLGFKLLDSLNYPNLEERLDELPYVFMRSDINKEIKIRQTLPPTLYLRNKTHHKDYMIQFRSTENLNTFLALFPESFEDEKVTQAYYSVPRPHDERKGNAGSGSTSELEDQSESRDTAE